MNCRFTFENHSQNRNVRKVGLFWKLNRTADPATPLMWHQICKCPYTWTHPVRISNDVYCRLVKLGGNTTPSVKTDEVDGFDDVRLRERMRATGRVLEVTLEDHHPYRRLELLRDDRAMLMVTLPPSGRIDVPIPDDLVVSSDVISAPGRPVRDEDVSPGAKSFELEAVAAIHVAMTGGEPGPDCRALAFSATDIEHW